MTYAGFFVHLGDIPPVLRWLQWLCPLKYTLEALSVNEVGSGLMIQDSLEGVPVNVSASMIMGVVSICVSYRGGGLVADLIRATAFRIRRRQLLARCAHRVRIHRRLRPRRYFLRMVQGQGEAVSCDRAAKSDTNIHRSESETNDDLYAIYFHSHISCQLGHDDLRSMYLLILCSRMLYTPIPINY